MPGAQLWPSPSPVSPLLCPLLPWVRTTLALLHHALDQSLPSYPVFIQQESVVFQLNNRHKHRPVGVGEIREVSRTVLGQQGQGGKCYR